MMPNVNSIVDNNSAANIRPPSPTLEQVRAGAARTVHPADVVDLKESSYSFPSRPTSPSLEDGLLSPQGNRRASSPALHATVSEELDESFVKVDTASSPSSSVTSLATEEANNAETKPEGAAETQPQGRNFFGFASVITSFFSNLGHKVQAGVEASEQFLSAAKAAFVEIGKSLIEAINKMITSLSPR